MIKQCMRLLLIQLRNFFGLNEAIYSKDKKKKSNLKLLGFSFLILGVMLSFYTGAAAYGLCYFGAEEMIPGYTIMTTSIVILCFTFLKCNGVIFQQKNYEMLISLPIRPSVIVASRFLTMYAGNLILTLLTMGPSLIVYSFFVGPGVLQIFMMLTTIFIIPLIPMTIATMAGAMITFIGVRMKHRNFAIVLLTLALMLMFFAYIFSMSSSEMKLSDVAQLTAEMTNRVNGMYPPAAWYTEAIVRGNSGLFLRFVFLSLICFAGFVFWVAKQFTAICSLLNTYAARGNYKMQELDSGTPLKAFYFKELKRYFSSNLYVLNTGIGFVLMLVLSFCVVIFGVDKIENRMEMEGVLKNFAPLVLAAMGSVSSTTAASISLEGKQWWIPKSLPISPKTIFDSKILVNLTLSVPSTLLSAILFGIALKTSGLSLLWLIGIPFLYNLFVAVLGIYINAKIPLLHWENETVPIKQGGATMLSILIGMLSVGIPIAGMLTQKIIPVDWVYFITAFFITIITLILYRACMKMDIRVIE